MTFSRNRRTHDRRRARQVLSSRHLNAKRFQEGDNGMLLKGNSRHPVVRMTS
jgi:hypothetical protein